MPEQNQTQYNETGSLLAEFGTRLNELEEKQRLLRDRALLIGENLVAIKEDSEKEKWELKKQINQINLEIKNLKQLVNRIVNEFSNLARKSELEILERQAKMFQPLELARIKDIESIIEKKLKNMKIDLKEKKNGEFL